MKKVLSWLLCCMLLLTPACVLAEDGIFEGTGAGHGGDLTVTMEVKDGKITSVTVKESHQETPGISDAAIETLPASIVEHQSLAVDTVAGAPSPARASWRRLRRRLRRPGWTWTP